MMCLSEIAEGVRGELTGGDAPISGVSTDTRSLNRGELFVALKGPSFDGHAFLDAARVAGASGAIVQAEVQTPLPVIRVADTLKALGALGSTWRSRFHIPVVAVTGSNGKTTVKEMIGAVLGVKGETLISTGNLNNEIGVPLVLCGLRPEHQYAAVELGMNHPGEIRYLSGLVKPTVAVITNAAAAHLQGLGTVEAVADAKGEIMAGLDAGGVMVLNRDDRFFEHWRRMAGNHSILSFGFSEDADVHATDYSEENGRFVLHVGGRSTDVALPLAGRHNVANALAAAAASFAMGLEPEQIKKGLERVKPVPGRLCVKQGRRGTRILDDSYNANPASVAAGIDVLAGQPGRRVLVLGDMAELGPDARVHHEQVGRYARSRGIDVLHGLGEMTEAAVQAFGPGGAHHHNRGELIERLATEVNRDTTILIKGSRSMHMDEIVQALVETSRPERGVL